VTQTLEDMLREAVENGSQVHLWPNPVWSVFPYQITVRERNGAYRSVSEGGDLIACLRGALTEDERKRRDALRVAQRKVDPAQMELEDAIAQSRAAPGHTDLMVTPEATDEFLLLNPPPCDDFEDLL